MKQKLFLLLVAAPLLMISCEGSRPRRMYDAYGKAYEEYENTGDPTMLIIMIVAGVLIGGIWLAKNMDK